MDSTTSTTDAVQGPTLLVRVGETVYGCGVAEVQEIIPQRKATRLPGAAPYIRGLINVRGSIVTVLDLGARLDETRTPLSDDEGSILLVQYHERLVGVAVDEVMDVRALSAGGDRSAEGAPAIVRAVAAMDDAPVVILDVQTLIAQVLLS